MENANTPIDRNAEVPLDEISAEVRNLLLTYPSLFKNRLDCLIHIFTTTNYVWTDDGRMIHEGLADYRDTMSYEDLDEREARNLEHIEEGHSYMAGLTQIRAYEIEHSRMKRALIEKHIIAVSTQMPSNASISYSMLSNMRLTAHCLERHMLGGAPFGRLHPNWLNAAEEFIDAVRQTFNHLFQLHWDPDHEEEAYRATHFEKMPARFQTLYHDMERIDALLDKQSERKLRAQEAYQKLKESDT